MLDKIKKYIKRYNQKKEVKRLKKASLLKLQNLKNKYRYETIACIGTGPSINEEDLTLLNGKVVILLNDAYKLLEKFNPKKAYCVVTDYLKLKEIRNKLLEINAEVFVSPNLTNSSEINLNLNYYRDFVFIEPYMKDFSYSRDFSFSKNLTKGIYLGNSVLFSAIQIASYMGAKKILILGCGFDYSKGYFDKKINQHAAPPELDYANKMMKHFKEEVEKQGKKLIYCCMKGKIDCLKKIKLRRALGNE
ncbi:MAG: 6-hydroxymethylpterin diphosphokinase MptE-like protein [Candidatus Woesearchaeota archaeon]